MTRDEIITALALAKQFHAIYERLAPSFGYETRQETRDFDPDSPNGRLMVAVCTEIIEQNFPMDLVRATETKLKEKNSK
jgi:hypothetical protein